MSVGGLSRAGCDRLRGAMTRHVERGALPGAVALVARGDDVFVEAVGTTTFGGTQPMRTDAVFRVASVTKPIVAAAAMTLVEECRLRLDDPVDPLLPELADRRVLRALDGPLDDTVPAERPITLRDLLTFRLGIGAVMVFPPRYAIQSAMEEAGVAPSADLPAHAPDELMRRYGGLPLTHQPGAAWSYNCGADILGVLLARAAGTSLGAVLRERVFDPLGMADTGFSVPAEQLHRLPGSYQTDFATGETVAFDGVGEDSRFARPPVFESGAGGLVSTAADLLAFGRVMLDKGAHGGGRLLSRASVELMTADHLTPAQKAASPFFPGFWDDHGWGLGVAVVTRRVGLAFTPGTYGWDGGYGTSWYVDPAEGLIGVLLTQRVWDSPSPPPVREDFWTAAYAAMED